MQVIVTPAADLDGIHKAGSYPANDDRTYMKGVMQCMKICAKLQAGILKPYEIGL